jgi:hypothetical protein
MRQFSFLVFVLAFRIRKIADAEPITGNQEVPPGALLYAWSWAEVAREAFFSSGVKSFSPIAVIASSILAFACSDNPTRGRRVSGRIKPSRLSAYLTAAGFSSAIRTANGKSCCCRCCASCIRPCLRFEKISRHVAGSMFDTVEMQPSPPPVRNAKAVVSSPDKKRNRGGAIGRRRQGRERSRAESFIPMNWDDSASLRSVSSANSRTVRAGTSCSTIGSAVELAIARKWASIIGLL